MCRLGRIRGEGADDEAGWEGGWERWGIGQRQSWRGPAASILGVVSRDRAMLKDQRGTLLALDGTLQR